MGRNGRGTHSPDANRHGQRIRQVARSRPGSLRMQRIVQGIVILLLGALAATGEEPAANAGTAAEQYAALAKEFHEAANAFYLKATKDEDRAEPIARIIKLSPRCLKLAEKNPKDPVALDALVQVVTQELW